MNALRTLAWRSQEFGLYGLLLLLPFSKAAVEIAFGFLFFGWLFERLDPISRGETLWRQPAFRPIAWAIGGFLGSCALSILVSDNPRLSLVGFVGKWVEYLLFFVIVTDVASRPRVIRRSLRILVYSAALVLVEGLTQERYGNGFFLKFRLDFFGRMTGPYENPIDLATYLMVIVPLFLAYAVVRRMAARWPLWGLLVLLSGCVARTQAVGAWLGLGAGLLLVIAMSAAMRRAGLALLIGVTLATGFFLYRGGRLGAKFSLSDIGSADRWYMWQAAIGMIRDRPVLGHGVNTFMSNYLRYRVGGQALPRYAHNCYLQVAAETGILGLLAFLWLLGLWFTHVMASLRRLRSDRRLILLGCAAGLLGFLVQSGVDTNFYALRQAALFWVLAGFALGLSGADLRPAPSASPARPQRPRA